MIKMIDITDKKFTKRTASASVKFFATEKFIKKIRQKKLLKGDCLAAAQTAAILAAKDTHQIIPLCHQINLSFVGVEFKFNRNNMEIISSAKAEYSTGVEMEALLACSVAALTIYDMAKAEEKNLVISDLKLLEKTGGKNSVERGADSV